MSKYLDAFAAYAANARAVADAEKDPHRARILRNYSRHAALEFSDMWDQIFQPDMTIDHPVYKVRLGSDDVQDFDGLEAVQGFYGALNTSVVWLQDEQLFVNDWGLASYSTFGQFISGKDAAAAGYDADDLEATYILTCPLAMFWPYDENAKLIGEEVYQLMPLQLVKPDPADVFTFEERAAVLKPYI